MLTATRYIQGLRLLGPAVLLYFASVALVGFAIDGGIYSVLLNLYLVRLGYGPELIGIINAVGTFSFALFSLPAGALGERFGSRRMLLVGQVMMLIGCALLPLADLLDPAFYFPWLVGNMIVMYLGIALFFVNTAPYVMSIIDATQRNQVFGAQTALMSLAAFIGSLVGGFLPPLVVGLSGGSLEQPGPYRFALILAGLAMIPGILALRAQPAHSVPQQSEQPAAQPAGATVTSVAAPILGLLLVMALVRMLQVAGVSSVSTFINVYLDAELLVPTAQIGMIIAVARLLGVPSALATSALTARFGNRGVVIGASLATMFSMLPLILIPHWAAAGLSFVGVIGLSWIRYAASLVYFLELVPPTRRATVSGVMEMAAGVCFTAMTFGGGYLISFLGYRSLFLLAAAITGLSALLFWLFFRKRGT